MAIVHGSYPPRFVTEAAVEAVRAAIDNATRLGLVWRLKPGTVVGTAARPDPSAVRVVVDGDTTDVLTVSMTGAVISGQRVWCLFVPPAGAYIVGTIGPSTVSPTVRMFDVSDTWERPPGLVWARVRLSGGGGQCGGCAATGAGEASEGGGGGGGGFAESIYSAAELGSSQTVTVGAGGSGGGAGAAGSDGAATSFGSLMTGNGGSGGNAGSATSTNTSDLGGNGGTASGGNVLNITGGDGGSGAITGGESSKHNSGGFSVLSTPVTTHGFTTAGQAGHSFGGGGGSTRNNDNESAQAGAPGAAGVVIVEEHYQ